MQDIHDGVPPLTDKGDVFQFISKVYSRIKKDVGVDFVLAKLEAKDREFIIEMVGNAYFVQRTLAKLSSKCQSKTQSEEVNKIRKRLFDNILVRTYMVTILNRNVGQNTMLNIIGDSRTAMEEEENRASEVKNIIQNEIRKEQQQM